MIIRQIFIMLLNVMEFQEKRKIPGYHLPFHNPVSSTLYSESILENQKKRKSTQIWTSIKLTHVYFQFIVDTITDVPSPPSPLLSYILPSPPLPSGHHHTVVYVYGLCLNDLGLIPSLWFIQLPSLFFSSDRCLSVPSN